MMGHAELRHESVMPAEITRSLEPGPSAKFVDGTMGLGGHTELFLERVGASGTVIGLDRDASMLERAEARLSPYGDRLVAVHARIAYVADVIRGLALDPVDGVLFDLGLCSAQLDDPERGFSFGCDDSPLDMRMNRTHGETARELLERIELAELTDLLRRGDVPSTGRVAQTLLDARPLETVGDLKHALERLRLPRRRHHPATLVFQALRLHVNRELQEVELALEGALEILRPGGRLAVLSYHSGEDRRVKHFLAREARGCICPSDLPRCGCGRQPRVKILLRGEAPSPAEIARNPRARSARLRVAERV